VNALTTRPRAG